MKVLVSTVGTRGDVEPMVVLAAALEARGHDVTLTAPPESGPLATAYGLKRYVPSGRDMIQWLAGFDVSRLFPHQIVRALQGYVRESFRLELPVLLEEARGADVVISAGLALITGSVAEHYRVPHAYTFFAPTNLPSRQHPPMLVQTQRLPGFVNAWLHRTGHRAVDAFIVPAIDEVRAHLGLGKLGGLIRFVGQTSMLLWDEELLPVPPDLADRFRDEGREPPRTAIVGALQGPARPLPPHVEDFLARGEAAYLGFGSMPERSPEEVDRVIAEATERAGVRGIVLSPRPAPAKHVLALGSVSHGALFPRLLGVAHHAGAGTTAAAARAGVPQIPVPHFIDQPLWAKALAHHGVAAATLHRKTLTAQNLAAALVACRDPALRQRARALGDRLRANDPAARAVAFVEELAASRRG